MVEVMQRLLMLLGAALIAAGLTTGFVVSVYSGETDCGSAFRDASGVAEATDTMTGGTGDLGCPGARSEARAQPVALLTLGAVLIVGGPLMLRRQEGDRAVARSH